MFRKFLILFILFLPMVSEAVPTSTALVFPVIKPRVSSNYGARKHPIFKVVRHHKGVDLAAPKGSYVRAISEGKVVFADPYAGYGNLVVVQHKDGITSHYGHLDTIKAKTGSRIRAGEIIGTVGSTGNSTGPHLHLEIRKNGMPLNPIKVIPSLTARAQG